MKQIWSILCQKSLIDAETNSMSIFNCIEEITINLENPTLPEGGVLLPATFEIASLWLIDDSTKENSFTTKIELLNPAEKVVSTLEHQFKVAQGYGRFRSRSAMQGIPVDSEGRYWFKIMIKDGEDYKEVNRLPLDIKLSFKIMD